MIIITVIIVVAAMKLSQFIGKPYIFEAEILINSGSVYIDIEWWDTGSLNRDR